MFPTQVEEQVFRCPQLAPHFLIEILRPDRMDEVVLHVEARDGLHADLHAECGTTLSGFVKDVIGISVRTRVVSPGSLGRSAGKANRVRDLRPC